MRTTRLIIIACLLVCLMNIRTAESAAGPAGNKSKVITLSHADRTAENTLDNPNVVVPIESEMNIAGTEFSCMFKPHSLTILRLPASTN